MKTRRVTRTLLVAAAAMFGAPASAQQCCLSGLFAGCGTCFRQAPAYAVAPVVAPVAAPIAAPPPPVMVPVQKTSYVPETTYRTQYQCVPVTTYKPSSEIDPCTGCPVDCMQPVTQYVQQAVNVPVTQYRAVTTTQYVQMQPGYQAPAAVGAPVAFPAGTAMPGPSTPVASPFAAPATPAAPVTTMPQGWGAAPPNVQNQLVPGQQSINPPALPATGYYPPVQSSPAAPQAMSQTAPQFVPQTAAPAATYLPQATAQPAAPLTITPAPSLKPIPELPRTTLSGTAPVTSSAPAASGTVPAPSLLPGSGSTAPALQPSTSGSGTAPAAGTSPTESNRAIPKLLAPTSHTTSWQPAADAAVPAPFVPAYPTAALPVRLSR